MKERYLRESYLRPCYYNNLSEIKNKIGENNISIAVDETTDRNDRYVTNLLVGTLKSNTPTYPFFLACTVLEKKFTVPLLHGIAMMDNGRWADMSKICC